MLKVFFRGIFCSFSVEFFGYIFYTNKLEKIKLDFSTDFLKENIFGRKFSVIVFTDFWEFRQCFGAQYF
jgi:hypothetical protein